MWDSLPHAMRVASRYLEQFMNQSINLVSSLSAIEVDIMFIAILCSERSE